MSGRKRQSRRLAKGQAMVEFVISVVPTLLLIFGLINLSIAVYDYNFVAFAAREATRYAAVRGSSSALPATTTDITNFVDGEAQSLDSRKLSVNTTWSPDNGPGSTVQVKVSYTFSFILPFMNLSSLNLSSQSQLVITQ